MKRRSMVLGIILISGALFTGCVRSGGTPDTKEPDTVTTDDTKEGQASGREEELQAEGLDKKDEKEKEGEDAAPEVRTVKVYYVDAETAEIKAKDVEMRDEFDLWKELASTGLLTEECKLLSVSVDEGSGRMSVDVNGKTGDLIRSMGTTGETEIIGCIINTYLDAYGCDYVLLTEEGETLETSSGADFSSYSGRIEF